MNFDTKNLPTQCAYSYNRKKTKIYNNFNNKDTELGLYHRRRIKTEEIAKVVAAVGGEEFIQFLAALAILPWTILNNRMHSLHCTRMI